MSDNQLELRLLKRIELITISSKFTENQESVAVSIGKLDEI